MKVQRDVVFSLAEIKEMNEKFLINLLNSISSSLSFDMVKNVLATYESDMGAEKQIQFWCDNVSDMWWGEDGNQEVDNVLCEVSVRGTIERIWVASQEIEHQETVMASLSEKLKEIEKKAVGTKTE
jgi:hypothetical protein